MKALIKISIVTGFLVLCVSALSGCGKNWVKSQDQTSAPTTAPVSTKAVSQTAYNATAEMTDMSDDPNITQNFLSIRFN